jgi:hypothetical protein
MRPSLVALAAICAFGAAAVVRPGPPGPAGPAAPEQPPVKSVALPELLRRNDPVALAELERRFAQGADTLQKQQIAVVLVRRLQQDQPYYDFLAGRAREAVESDMPFPMAVGPQGHFLPQQFAPAFLRWANEKGIRPDQAAAYALTVAPLDVLMLALTDDARARELLLRGLESHNYMVVYRAAWGLARLRDRSAIGPIVAAAEDAPADGGELIARALVLFDAPEAQAAAGRLIADQKVLEALRSRASQELAMNIGEGPWPVGRD